MSEEFNHYDTSRFSDETRQLLASGMSALAAQESMGLASDANAEIRRREAAELAADMERKNKENQLRRAAAATGGLQVPPATADQKPKLKGRRKKNMLKQEPTKILPASHIPEQPVATQQAPKQAPVQQSLPPGLTAEDLALIEQVKASRNRSVASFLDTHDPVHPNAFDARPVEDTQPQPQQPQWAQNPAQQERTILNEQHAAAYNGQGNSAYGQAAQYETPVLFQQVQRPQFNFVPPQQPPVQPQQPALPAQPQFGYVQAQHVQSQPVQPPVQLQQIQQLQQPPAAPYAPPLQMAESAGWDDEVDPDATGDTPVDAVETPVTAEALPAVEPSVVHSVTPAPFDPGVPDRDFSAFTEIVGLPSRGIFYQDRLFGQGLTTVDADMLSAMDPDDPMDVSTTFTAILGRRIRGISPEDILSADEEFLVYWLRESTYLTESLPKPRFRCERCGTVVSSREQFDMLGRLGFANQEFVTENDPSEVAALHAAEGFVRFTMFDGRECAIYLRRRKHDRAIAEYMGKWEKANKKEYPAYRLFNTSIASFVEIEDCETMSDKIRFLEEYPLSKREDLLKAIYGAQVASRTFINVKCPNPSCGGTARLPYSFQPTPFVASLR